MNLYYSQFSRRMKKNSKNWPWRLTSKKQEGFLGCTGTSKITTQQQKGSGDKMGEERQL